MTERAWEPLLVGEHAAEARAIVDDIASELAARPPSPLPAFKGDAGTVLLLAECSSSSLAPRLEQLLLTATSVPLTIALFGGASALAWLLDQLAEGPEVNALREHFDAALWRYLDVHEWQDRKDLASGLAGVGVMLASRNDAPARRMAERVLAHFEASAIESGPGITWRNEPRFLPESERALFPDGMVDLGVLHGVPGVIGMLAQFVEADIEVERSRSLLERAIAWLLRAVPSGCPRFGTSWPIDHWAKRIGWCYGDTGVASALLLASRALHSVELAGQALDLLRQVIPVLEECGAPDACFCHGAAGFAHVYNVAFQRSGDLEMRDQAVRWVREVIGMRSPGTGIAGYASLAIDGPAPRWEEDPTLLSGVVGTALVLLAAIEDREPAWQRLFAV